MRSAVRPQQLLRDIPVNGHGNGRVAVDNLGDDRVLGLIGEGVDEVHLVFDVVHDLLDIGILLQFNGHRSQVLTG